MDLTAEAKKLGIELGDFEESKFSQFAQMLLKYNEVMNLTAITDREEIDEKHFLDSLTLLLSQKIADNCKIIDIGAGAGFPSIPLKIVRENADITMLDSLNKRVGFLNDVIKMLELKNISAIHLRAEEAGRKKEYRERFDVATARAVADMAVLAEYALPFVRVGGHFVAMKGTAPSEEINRAEKAIKTMGGEIKDIKEIILPSGIKHSVITIEKVIKAPNSYPRKPGKPSKDPIL